MSVTTSTAAPTPQASLRCPGALSRAKRSRWTHQALATAGRRLGPSSGRSMATRLPTFSVLKPAMATGTRSARTNCHLARCPKSRAATPTRTI
jgi:hypothetical protein